MLDAAATPVVPSPRSAPVPPQGRARDERGEAERASVSEGARHARDEAERAQAGARVERRHADRAPVEAREAARSGEHAGAHARGERRRGEGELSDDDRQVVERLRARDAEVRAHEAAHQAAAGALGGGASFEYRIGPDGRPYAVGGHVPVRIAPGRTPEETIRNAQQIRAAATAPGDPSPQDLAVAAAAADMEFRARAQLAQRAAAAYRGGRRG
jgi:hypothetical protein